MTLAAAAVGGRERFRPGTLLVAGLVIATLTEALAGTVLSLGRAGIIGDTHATPDEFAWLDVGYTAARMTGFIAAPWLMSRIPPVSLTLAATLVMGVACAMAAMTARLDLLIALRIMQGLSGGVLLVAGQTVLFLAYPRRTQPILQALFAMGSVVAPATVAPALQGYLLDGRSWTWIFFAILPLALAASGLMLLAEAPKLAEIGRRRADWMGLAVLSTALFPLTYVLSQGSRWDWFDEHRIVWLSAIGAASLIAFLGREAVVGDQGLIGFAAFRSHDFCFAFIVSFVAGAALFGSAYLIPSFAVSVLGMTLSEAGRLLLPSGALFTGALLFAAFLMQVRRTSPIVTVPFGILTIMLAMWMLSGSTGESGADDMMAAILLRGLGLGLLFLSITLIAFGNLGSRDLASGIALFNTGRQLGGLAGIAGLQTLIDHHVAGNAAVLGAHVAGGRAVVGERLAATTALLVDRGMEPMAAGRAATVFLSKAVAGQSAVIAFDTAFTTVALLFVAAAPVIVIVKIALSRHAKRRDARSGSSPADSRASKMRAAAPAAAAE